MRVIPFRIQTPDGAAMPVVGTKPLSVHGVPHVRVMIFSAAEKQVSVEVILDLGD